MMATHDAAVVRFPPRTSRSFPPAGPARVTAFRSAPALLDEDTASDRRVDAFVEHETARRTARDRAVDIVQALEATAKGRAVLHSYALAETLDALAWVLPVNPRVDRALAVVLRALIDEPNGWQ